MKPLKVNTEENLNIPLDMLLDILSIIVKEQLQHEVIRVIPNRSLVVMAISIDPVSTKIPRVLQNIQSLLADYHQYRSWENEELNWRTS